MVAKEPLLQPENFADCLLPVDAENNHVHGDSRHVCEEKPGERSPFVPDGLCSAMAFPVPGCMSLSIHSIQERRAVSVTSQKQHYIIRSYEAGNWMAHHGIVWNAPAGDGAAVSRRLPLKHLPAAAGTVKDVRRSELPFACIFGQRSPHG